MKATTMKAMLVTMLALAAVLAALALTATGCGDSASAAPGADVKVLTPSEFNLKDYAGKPLVINLFGSWCGPCNLEAPDLATFSKDLKGAQMIGIAINDTESAAVGFMQKYGLGYPMVLDDGSLGQQFGITGVPETVFIDAQGNEQTRLVGAATLDQFNAALAKVQ